MQIKSYLFSWEFITIFSGRLLNGLLLLAATRVYSSSLSDYEIGRLAIMLSFLFLFTSLIFFPIGSYINQKILFWLDNSKWQTYLASYFMFVLILILPLSIFSAIFIDYKISLLAIFYLFGLCLNQTLIPIINIMLYRKIFVLMTLCTSILYVLLSYFFISQISPSAEYWLLGQSLSNIFFGVVALFIVIYLNQSRLSFRPRFSYIKNTNNVFNFAAPLVLTSLVGWTILNFYKISASYVFGVEAIAALALCGVLSNGVFGAVESATLQLYHADYLQKLSISNDSIARKNAFEEFFKNVMTVLTLALVLLILFAPFIIRLSLDERFHGFIWLLQLFFLMDYFRNLTHIVSQFAYAEFATSVLIRGNLIASIFSILLICLSLMSSFWMLYIPLSLIGVYLINSYLQYRRACSTYGNIYLLPKTANLIIILITLIFVYAISNIF